MTGKGGNGFKRRSGRQKFAFFCEEWLRLERGRVKDSTYVKYNAILTKHIIPKLGGCAPSGISTPLVERFKRGLLDEGLSAKTVRDILAVLQSVLRHMTKQCPGPFTAAEVSYPRELQKEARVLSIEEQRRFATYLRADMDECKFGILLALSTGLRIGELCALRWRDVSLQDRTIRVVATMQRLQDLDGSGGGKTKVVIGSPKTDSSARTIPLMDSAVDLCAQFDPHCPAAFLLTGTERYMEPRQVQKRLAKYTAACGIEGVHFHSIRHTFATRCVEVGFEIKTLSEILGHANTSITLNRYVHSSMDLKRTNMEKLAAMEL